MKKEISFIIQARMGSTRLPNKVLLPYFNKLSILDIIVNKLKNTFPNNKIIIATTTNSLDDSIVSKATSLKVNCFRGSESNVLDRFIECAKKYECEHIIRICSDNPFLDMNELKILVSFCDINNYDYVSFNVYNKPSILTHFGFWSEYVSLESLKKVAQITNEKLFLEHVTNFIYNNVNIFKIKLLDTKYFLNKKIRLTVDSQADFDLSKKIYYNLYSKYKENFGIEEIKNYIDNNSDLLNEMNNEIINNIK